VKRNSHSQATASTSARSQTWPGQCEHKALKAAVAASKKAAEQEKIAQLMLETPVRVLHR